MLAGRSGLSSSVNLLSHPTEEQTPQKEQEDQASSQKFMSERKMKLSKRVVMLTVLLVPSSWPLSALSWNSLTYQEAVFRCSRGDQYACQVMYQYREYERRYNQG